MLYTRDIDKSINVASSLSIIAWPFVTQFEGSFGPLFEIKLALNLLFWWIMFEINFDFTLYLVRRGSFFHAFIQPLQNSSIFSSFFIDRFQLLTSERKKKEKKIDVLIYLPICDVYKKTKTERPKR